MHFSRKTSLIGMAAVFDLYGRLTLFLYPLSLVILLFWELILRSFANVSLLGNAMTDPSVQLMQKIFHELLNPEYHVPLFFFVLAAITMIFSRFFIFLLAARIVRKAADEEFYNLDTIRSFRSLRKLLFLSLGASLLQIFFWNRLLELLLPVITEDLQTTDSGFVFVKLMMRQGWTDVFSLDPSPALKVVLALVCSFSIGLIRRTLALSTEVQVLRKEQSFIV